MVLGMKKETVEAYLGHTVTHTVVTVPACKHRIYACVRVFLTDLP